MLEAWVDQYQLNTMLIQPKAVGIVMAGNIPLVGFHDFLCVFISGHKAIIKPSSKDEVLIKHLAEKIIEWNKEAEKLYFICRKFKRTAMLTLLQAVITAAVILNIILENIQTSFAETELLLLF